MKSSNRIFHCDGVWFNVLWLIALCVWWTLIWHACRQWEHWLSTSVNDILWWLHFHIFCLSIRGAACLKGDSVDNLWAIKGTCECGDPLTGCVSVMSHFTTKWHFDLLVKVEYFVLRARLVKCKRWVLRVGKGCVYIMYFAFIHKWVLKHTAILPERYYKWCQCSTNGYISEMLKKKFFYPVIKL